MAEEIWTILEVGPFDKSKTEAVQEVVDDIFREWGGEHDPEATTTDEGVRILLVIGSVNYGAGRMFDGLGHIPELQELEVPYVLHDDGKSGVGVGTDFSWHPSYGDLVKHRERNNESILVLPEDRLKLIPPCSNEELGRAVKAYFAEPGSPEATAGWPLWDKDYERPAQATHRIYTASTSDSDEVPPELVKEVMNAVSEDEPAIHFVGTAGGGFAAYGPYKDRTEAMDRHEPEIDEILTIVDRSVRDEDQLTADDIDPEHFGVVWVDGNLIEGFSARGIYRNVDAAVESNDGKDGFVVALVGPLQ